MEQARGQFQDTCDVRYERFPGPASLPDPAGTLTVFLARSSQLRLFWLARRLLSRDSLIRDLWRKRSDLDDRRLERKECLRGNLQQRRNGNSLPRRALT